MDACRACGCSFTGCGSKKKRTVESKVHGHGVKCSVKEGVKKALKVDVTPGQNVCDVCFKTINRVTVLSAKVKSDEAELASHKRKLTEFIRDGKFLHPHLHKKICFSPRKTTTPRKVKTTPLTDTVLSQIKNTKYDSAIRTLVRSSKKAREDIKKVFSLLVQDEVRTFSKKISSMRQDLTLKSIEKFCWGSLWTELDSGLPLLAAVLRSVLTSRRAKDKISSSEKKIGPLVPMFGLLLGVILYTGHPSKFKFLQQIISIQMFRSGCNHKMFRWFKKFGLCMSVDSTRQLVDKLGKDYDKKIKEWKQDIEEHVLHVTPTPIRKANAAGDSDGWSSLSEDELDMPSDHPDSDTDDEIHELSTVMEDTILYSESDHEDEFVPLAEVSDPELNDIAGFSLCWDNVQKLSVARHHSRHHGNKMMLWANCFAARDRISFSGVTNNWEETVNAGSIDLALSVERMIEGRITMTSSEQANDCLEGLIPRPQNFHKRVILLQVTLGMLFGKGASDKGTLTQIKNVFGRKNVKKKASDCMNHLTDFINFVTEGHILLLANHLKKTDDLTHCIEDLGDVSSLAKEIVQFVWPRIDEPAAALNDELYYNQWFCSEVCTTAKDTDHKQAYAMSVLCRGLMHMAERDAERENGGDAMIRMLSMAITDTSHWPSSF
ncbi:hypothetical protein MAR_028967 [Mya arenaria]|uniref:DUF6589 domain-containing protein n=1 Tax=Mya arenaria TaxID=6604 RepID=A0ABY7DF40_MYAAR|nr:hypothetical protein MAR_028967 [Mya arenaria]